MEYLITDLDSLVRLEKEKNLKTSIRKIKLNLEDKSFSQPYERKINRYYFACGCSEGAVAVYISLFCSFLALWITGFETIHIWWKIIIVVTFSAIAGKLYGLLISKYRLKKLFRILENYFKENLKK